VRRRRRSRRRIDDARQRGDHVRAPVAAVPADLLGELSNRLKAPLVRSVRGKELMAYDDPHWMGGLGMIGTKAVYNAVQQCEPAADGRNRLSLPPISCPTKAQ